MKKIYIAAGGTGGHINAALAMGEELGDQYQVSYLTGTRYLDYQLFKDTPVLHLKSRPLRTKNPLTLVINIFLNLLVFLKIILMYMFDRPAFVLGAGGYICGPTLLAARFLFIPIFIIEQNAVAGVTNKILSKVSSLVFTNFENTKGIKKTKKVLNVGNPIRKSIQSTQNSKDDKLKVLVFGGSLGASQINKAIEIIIKEKSDLNLDIIHQVGKGSLIEDISIAEGISYEQLEYIDDMQKVYAWANIIIARSGASTVSELRIVKKPTIIVPFPAATDNHQYYNAKELKEEDGFFVEIIDHKLKGEELAFQIKESIGKIESKNLYYQNELAINRASECIKNEILKYVRN